MTTLTPRAECSRTWRKYVPARTEANPPDLHACALTVGHPGDEHECECGVLKVLPEHPNRRALRGTCACGAPGKPGSHTVAVCEFDR